MATIHDLPTEILTEILEYAFRARFIEDEILDWEHFTESELARFTCPTADVSRLWRKVTFEAYWEVTCDIQERRCEYCDDLFASLDTAPYDPENLVSDIAFETKENRWVEFEKAGGQLYWVSSEENEQARRDIWKDFEDGFYTAEQMSGMMVQRRLCDRIGEIRRQSHGDAD